MCMLRVGIHSSFHPLWVWGSSLATRKSLIQNSTQIKLVDTWEVDRGRSEVQGHPLLPDKFQVGPGCLRPLLKNRRKHLPNSCFRWAWWSVMKHLPGRWFQAPGSIRTTATNSDSFSTLHHLVQGKTVHSKSQATLQHTVRCCACSLSLSNFI